MAAGGGVKLKNYREVVRAMQRTDSDTARMIKQEMKQAGETVASDARSRISRYRGASVNTINPRSVQRGVFVTQRAKKVTGRRGDFGALQMRHLLAARAENEDEIVKAVERAFDRIADMNGF